MAKTITEELAELGLDEALMPKWKQVQLIDGGAVSSRLVMKDGEPLTTPDGRPVLVPALPYEWWIDASGSVSAVPVSTNRSGKEADLDVKYERHIKRSLRKANAVPYYELEPAERVRIIRERRARQAIINAPVERLAKSAGEQIAEALTTGNKKLVDQLVAQLGGR